jgi:aminotransferase
MQSALRTRTFGESVIRGMSRLAARHQSINLAQGFPNFPAPDALKEAAARAILEDVNQYAITWGAKRLRDAVAAKYAEWYRLVADPETEITITCGATEAMAATMLALVDPGDEVIVFEPFYENYGPDAILCGASPVFVPLPAGERLDLERLAAAFTPRTRGIIINSPANPSGLVLTRDELEGIAKLCMEHDVLAFTDEIYEHILYDGTHLPLATIPGMRDRTVTISGSSKTFSITGWRIGTIVAPAALTASIRKVHDFLTVGAPAPLQEALGATMETLGRGYYEGLSAEYRARREILLPALRSAGFLCTPPAGAYYILADYSSISDQDDTAFSAWLTTEIGVTPVPGSGFYRSPDPARKVVRFAFCKTEELLHQAAGRLGAIGRAP